MRFTGCLKQVYFDLGELHAVSVTQDPYTGVYMQSLGYKHAKMQNLCSIQDSVYAKLHAGCSRNCSGEGCIIVITSVAYKHPKIYA